MRYFGYRPEQTYGTEDTSATVRYLQMGKCTLDVPTDPDLEVPTFEETPSRTKRGLYSPSGDIEIALDIYSINEFLKFTLGNELTPSTGKYLMYPGSGRILPSFTAYVGKDDGNPNDFEHIFYGCVISKLSISLSDGLATATISIQAQKDGKAALKADNAITFSDSYPIAFYEAETKLGSSSLTARTTSFDFEFDNGISAANGRAFGSMFPYKLPSSGKTPTIKTNVFYEGYDFLVKFWGDSDGPTCNTTYESYQITFTDEQENILILLFPRVALSKAGAPIEGTDEIKQSLEFKVLKAEGSKPTGYGSGNLRTSVIAAVTIASS